MNAHSDSKQGHTPGPWEYKTDRFSGDCGIHANGAGVFAEAFADIRYAGEGNRVEAQANARLIAAAPDMLGVLRKLIATNDDHGPFGGEMYQDRIDRAWDEARAAIAKATGASS